MPINVWASGDTACAEGPWQAILEIPENQHVVIGRQEGGEIDYLDPQFLPTQLVPLTGQSVLKQRGRESDTWVSRGHFMLRAQREGLVLVNGVPRRGGGVRAPVNGTTLLDPQVRAMIPGEEFIIARGTIARIQLPNDTVIVIQAD